MRGHEGATDGLAQQEAAGAERLYLFCTRSTPGTFLVASHRAVTRMHNTPDVTTTYHLSLGHCDHMERYTTDKRNTVLFHVAGIFVAFISISENQPTCVRCSLMNEEGTSDADAYKLWGTPSKEGG